MQSNLWQQLPMGHYYLMQHSHYATLAIHYAGKQPTFARAYGKAARACWVSYLSKAPQGFLARYYRANPLRKV